MDIYYFIITTEAIKGSLQAFIKSKSDKKYKVLLYTCEEIEASMHRRYKRHEAILAFVHKQWSDILHEAVLPPLHQPKAFLLLVGDYDTVPGYPLQWRSQNIVSDTHYTMPTEEDVVPRAPTGRISTNDPDKVAAICKLLLNYPQKSDQAWQRRVILTGFIPRGLDAVDMDYWYDSGWQSLKEVDLAGYKAILRFENDRRLEGMKSVCGHGTQRRQIWQVENTTKQDLISAIEEGALVVGYYGHGNTGFWGNIGLHDNASTPVVDEAFYSSDVKSLQVGTQLPLVISAACQTGDIITLTSFAETWQVEQKAVGVFAADEGSGSAMAEHIRQRILEYLFRGNRPIGVVLNNAILDLHNDMSGVVGEEVLRIETKNYRYFGDPDTVIPVFKRISEETRHKKLLCYLEKMRSNGNPMDCMTALQA